MEPGTRLVVQDLGDGPAVVLVPGFGLDHTLWDRTALLLASAGYRVVCVDQRGHGGSDKPFTGYEVTRLAADLGAVIDTLALDDATVVGHSFGGQVAFGLAAARRDLVGKLVLVGSSGVRASRSIGFPFGAPVEAVLPALLSGEEQDRISSRRETLVSAFAQKPTEEVTAWLLEISLRMPSRAALACYHSMLETDLLDLIPAVTQPVLQVIGAHDPVHSARGARWLNAQLASATLVELPDCGHYPMLEAPTEFERAVLEFLPTR
ncbi:alpha/beta fold hydrolase [Parafrankia sp. FMc2]|uniref:alpha/beta fold hydrolase n=1 Tax=Parafrankia sp. FMc2 TaxID=3233196 RepID=UPI0034D5F597